MEPMADDATNRQQSPTERPNGLIRTGLRANAIFSLATGAVLALAPNMVGQWLGVSIDGWLRLLGIALLGHAVLLVWALRRPDVVAWAKLNLAAIAPYPLLMVALVATGLIDRDLGRVLALLDGALVGFLAVIQFVGLRGLSISRQPRIA